MHKAFYASGFLYHSPSQQILLQQIDNNKTVLSLFTGNSETGEEVSAVFQRIIYQQLGITIPLTSINPIYDYFYKDFGTDHFLQYAEVDDIDLAANLQEQGVIRWFPLQKISKLNMPDQVRHDIIIGQRVIRAAEENKYKQSISILNP